MCLLQSDGTRHAETAAHHGRRCERRQRRTCTHERLHPLAAGAQRVQLCAPPLLAAWQQLRQF